MVKLAAFGAGGSLAGTAGLSLKSAASATGGKQASCQGQAQSTGAATNSTGGILATQLRLATADYLKATTNTYSMLTNEIGGVAQIVQERWTNSVGATDENLSVATNINQIEFQKVGQAIFAACKNLSGSGTNQPTALAFDKQILSILQAVERYGAAVHSQIKYSVAITNAIKSNLRADLTTVVRDVLDKAINQRERDISSYETSINIINSGATAK
jgi:hypothetical protein